MLRRLMQAILIKKGNSMEFLFDCARLEQLLSYVEL